MHFPQAERAPSLRTKSLACSDTGNCGLSPAPRFVAAPFRKMGTAPLPVTENCPTAGLPWNFRIRQKGPVTLYSFLARWMARVPERTMSRIPWVLSRLRTAWIFS